MILSYKYRIYPNQIQREALDSVLELCRYLYNSALEERVSYYKKYHQTLTYNKQASELPGITKLFPEFAGIYSQTLQQTLKQLDGAFKNFFRRLKAGAKPGFPRYRGKGRFKSILFPQIKGNIESGGIKLLPNKKISVFGIPEELKVWWHRPCQGRCKQARLKQEADKYYLILVCDEVPLEPLAKTGKVVGIDLGLSSFITTDDGTKFHHPKPLKEARDRLVKVQQELSRKQRGSNNRQRAKLRLARCHLKISNIRGDFAHKVAGQLVRDYDTIVLEKLNIQEMLQSNISHLNSAIADASWSVFVEYLSYKAVRADKQVVFVDPRNTSKTCNCCGHLQEMPLQQRTFDCGACGAVIDRDINAAKNIKRLGMSLAAHQELQKPSALC